MQTWHNNGKNMTFIKNMTLIMNVTLIAQTIVIMRLHGAI